MKTHSNTTKRKFLPVFLGILLFCVIILLLPIWNVSHIIVKSNSYYDQDSILKAGELREGMHVLEIDTNKALAKIETLPYVEKAMIDYTFPNTLTIEVIESTPIGYVPFLGTYLCLNEQGQALEQVTQPHLELPIIQGLAFEKFEIGKKILFQNEDKFLILVDMINTLKTYKYIQEVDSIDISNIEQMHLYVNKLDVIIGNIRDFDKKIEWLMQVYKEYPMGVLDLSLIEFGQAILTPLT